MACIFWVYLDQNTVLLNSQCSLWFIFSNLRLFFVELEAPEFLNNLATHFSFRNSLSLSACSSDLVSDSRLMVWTEWEVPSLLNRFPSQEVAEENRPSNSVIDVSIFLSFSFPCTLLPNDFVRTFLTHEYLNLQWGTVQSTLHLSSHHTFQMNFSRQSSRDWHKSCHMRTVKNTSASGRNNEWSVRKCGYLLWDNSSTLFEWRWVPWG